MSNNEHEEKIKLYKKLKNYLNKYFFWIKDEDREEILNDCFEKWERNPNRRLASFKHVIIDALRSHSNFSRKSRTSRLSFERLKEPDDSCFSGLSQYDSDPDKHRRDFGAFIHSCGDLRRDEKIIIMLKYVWGFNYAEIGEVAGYSESRACQKINQIQEEIKGRISPEEFRKPALQESRTISQQIQARSELPSKTKKELGRICKEKGATMGFRAFPKIWINTKSKIEFKKVFFKTGCYRKKEASLQRMGTN